MIEDRPRRLCEPNLDGPVTRWQIADRYYSRKQRIARGSDLVVAFVAPDWSGATEDTISRAKRAGKPVEVR